MDPNENLNEQLRLADIIQDGMLGPDYDLADIDRLAELVIALDEWITKGGFIPQRWNV